MAGALKKTKTVFLKEVYCLSIMGIVMNNSCNFSDLDLKNTPFHECTIRDTHFKEINLTGADFRGSDLSGNLFHNTNLNKSNFVNAVNYSINPLTNKLSNILWADTFVNK